MSLIFVAGPISAPTLHEQEANVERAMLAGWELLQRGHHPVLPHLTFYFDMFAAAFMPSVPTYEQYLAWSCALLRRCDGVLFLGASPGANREVALARELGLPVWTIVDEVPVP